VTWSTFHRWVMRSSMLLRTLFPTSEGAELTFCRSRDFAITVRCSALLRPQRLADALLSSSSDSPLRARPRPRESVFG